MDTDPSRRDWAAGLFRTALPTVEEFSSPRAWAFALLGLDAYCALANGDPVPKRVRKLLADRLMSLCAASETKDWVWFEDLLAYDNARLPQALIQTGLTTAKKLPEFRAQVTELESRLPLLEAAVAAV